MTTTGADSTLTIRVPRSWVGRVTASCVRQGIRRYLANPVRLPKFEGLLDARVSWRLPENDLQQIGRDGDRGDMIRRIVAAALRSGDHSPLPRRTAPAQAKDTDIVSEELIGEDASGGVIVLQLDRRGFGYRRVLGIDRETYVRAGRR